MTFVKLGVLFAVFVATARAGLDSFEINSSEEMYISRYVFPLERQFPPVVSYIAHHPVSHNYQHHESHQKLVSPQPNPIQHLAGVMSYNVGVPLPALQNPNSYNLRNIGVMPIPQNQYIQQAGSGFGYNHGINGIWNNRFNPAMNDINSSPSMQQDGQNGGFQTATSFGYNLRPSYAVGDGDIIQSEDLRSVILL